MRRMWLGLGIAVVGRTTRTKSEVRCMYMKKGHPRRHETPPYRNQPPTYRIEPP